ncbi:Two-component osmosensing histidine kinase (Bos1), partial [Rasamsonia emersonii CBS 393.64]
RCCLLQDAMAGEDDAFQAAAEILKGLAREVPASDDSEPSTNSVATNGFDPKQVKLPGEPSPGKTAFETELQALIGRIHDLETELVSDPLPSFFWSPWTNRQA